MFVVICAGPSVQLPNWQTEESVGRIAEKVLRATTRQTGGAEHGIRQTHGPGERTGKVGSFLQM